MNTAVILPAQGICFAIAVNTVRFLVPHLPRDGVVHRCWLGLAGHNAQLARRVVRALDPRVPSGVLVLSVEKRSPAERSGLLTGDIVVGFEEESVADMDDLQRLLTAGRAGKAAPLTILRRGEKRTLDIAPEIRPSAGD